MYINIEYCSYNNTINTKENSEENINEIKERLFICYKNLVGEEISTKVKEKNRNKNIIQFLNEFNKKMECTFEIFSLLENYEKSINNITQDLYKEKKELIDKKKYKKKFKLNEESPFLVKLCLKYSLNYINKKRDFLMNNANNKNKTKNKNENNDSEMDNNLQETINNLNLLHYNASYINYKLNNIYMNDKIIFNKFINKRIRNIN